MKSTRFKVAEHIFDVSSAQTDIVKILPNLEPFVSGCDGEPLYTINIDNNINPSWRGSRIGYFPCPSASFEVYRMDNGAYQILILRHLPCDEIPVRMHRTAILHEVFRWH